MDIYFNELSIRETEYQDYLFIRDAYRKLRECNYNVCRISPDCMRQLLAGCDKYSGFREIRNMLYSFLQQPYESDEVDAKQEEYLAHQWTIYDEEPYGLALSIIMDSGGMSLPGDKWNSYLLPVKCDDSLVEARNIYDAHSANNLIEWVEANKDVELMTTDIAPENKKFHVRDDHGSDVLRAFSKRLFKSQYVVEVINSLEFQSHNREFIHKIKGEGIVEIVLPWTDQGLGMAVRTTGRNIRETEKIAEILREEYCRK